jgi:hypothetical protein
VVDDVERLLQEAPAKDRWNWWWDTYGKQMSEPDGGKMEALAKELAREHQTPEQVRAFLIEVDSSISPLSPWANPPILKFWVDENPEAFLVLTGPDHWNFIPQRFQEHISTAIVRHNQDYVQRKCREIVEKLPDIPGTELHDFMNLVTLNRISLASLKETFFDIAKRGSNLNRGYFIYRLYFYFKDTNDGDSYLELINAATHDDLSNVFCNHLAFSLHTLKKDFQITKQQLFDSLRSTVRPLIHALKKLDYHALEVVEFVCGDNIDDYIDLIDRRITAARLDSTIDVIPFDGMPSVKGAINSQESFNKFADRISLWQREKLLSSFDVGYLLESIADTKNGCTCLPWSGTDRTEIS